MDVKLNKEYQSSTTSKNLPKSLNYDNSESVFTKAEPKSYEVQKVIAYGIL